MQQLSEQLLLLARLDTGRLDQQRRPVDLDDVIAGVLERDRAPGGIDLDATSVGPVQVMGQPILLEQLVRNLIDNAMAHAQYRVTIALRRESGGAVLTVDDDGPGIPTDQRTAVFDRFTRLDHARTRSHQGGTGLGLAIVADIARVHAGTVEVDESPQGGARFVVRLPTTAA